MKATVTITSSMPWLFSSSTMCSMHGLPTTGTIGFGWFEVSGRSRVPSPPAITTAFTRSSLAAWDSNARQNWPLSAFGRPSPQLHEAVAQILGRRGERADEPQVEGHLRDRVPAEQREGERRHRRPDGDPAKPVDVQVEAEPQPLAHQHHHHEL